jgi:flavin reductase (DIM6/NTAB) family NADH-FMN oxidoreductase RutF
MAYLTAIPHVIFLVTTLKENGKPNAALHGWASFTGESDTYMVIMPVMKHTHTYHNMQRADSS